MSNRRGCGGLRFFNADSKGSDLRNCRHRGGFVCRIVKSEVCAFFGNLTPYLPTSGLRVIGTSPPEGQFRCVDGSCQPDTGRRMSSGKSPPSWRYQAAVGCPWGSNKALR